MNTINNPPSPINKIAQINRLLQLDNLKDVKELLVLLLRYFPLDIVAGANVTIEKDTNFSVYKITASGSGTTLLLQTEGVDNPVQNLLNLVAGTNMLITDDGAGNITFDATGGSGGTYTVNNGLSPEIGDPNNFQWGGTLIQNTTIDATALYNILFTGANPDDEQYILDVQNTSTGSAIRGQANGGGGVGVEGVAIGAAGVFGRSTNQSGVFAFSINSSAVTAQSTNGAPIIATGALQSDYTLTSGAVGVVNTILKLRKFSSGNSIIGGGVGIELWAGRNGSGGVLLTGKISSVYEDVTNGAEFASLEFSTVGSGTLDVNMILKGSGQLRLPKYGTGTPFTGTVFKSLGVDSSGNVIEFTGGGSSPLTTKGDLFTFDTADARLPVGLDTQVLLADSSTATGLKWGSNTTPPASGYYGQYFSYITQNATTANVGVAMIFGTLDLSNGITVVTDGTNDTKITFAHTGIYNLQFSTQFQNTDNAEQDVYIWLRKNGTTSAADVLGSTGLISIPKTHGGGGGTPGHVIVTWNFLLDIVAGDFYQIVWSTSNVTKVSIKFLTATVNHPSTASTLFTVTQQAGILAGTGITAINSLTASSQTLASTDLNISSSVATHNFSIANNAVTYAKMQAVGNLSRLLGSSSTTTAVQEITIGSGLTLTGTTLTASGGTIGFKVPTITEVMSTTLALTNSIEYVASVDKLYVANGNNNVNIFNATTGELLSTVLLTQAFRVRYISSINEIWATSVNVASITRISPTTNASLGTITIGIEANGYDILEISSTKVYVSINTNGLQKIQIINPTILAWVSNITVSITNFASGMALNSNPSSAQNGIVILGTTGAGSVNLINSTTNLVIATVTPGGISSSFEVAYSAADDKYYIASQGNGRIISLNITGLTTLTLDKIKYNAFLTISLQIDDTNDLLIINQVANSASNLANMCHFIKKSTFESLYNIITPAAGGGGSRAGSVKLDLPNKRVFLTGRSTGSLPVVTLKY